MVSRNALVRVIPFAFAVLLFAGPTRAQAPVQNPAQSPAPVELPVTRVVLFSSGVGYFEHQGAISGNATVDLPFGSDEVNDALKSLVVWDLGKDASQKAGGAAGAPSVSYPSEESLDRALKGFRIDLSGSPRIADMLARLRGADLAVDAPDTISGKIVSVESRPGGKDGSQQLPWLILLTSSGVRAISLDDIVAFRFADPAVASDFSRALSLIYSAQDSLRRVLELHLPGSGTRQAALGYVVAAPVWKVSYRLDLSGDKPYLQGWAIVDNPTDQDWKDVSLSLVSGRPVSFQQNLYAPYYLDRPFVPLAIAGTAAPRSFQSGNPGAAPEEQALSADEYESMAPPSAAPAPAASRSALAKAYAAPSGAAMPSLSQGTAAAAQARAAGDQFEFTVRGAVTLERRHSAMLPLIAGAISAEKVSIYSPGSGDGGADPLHPSLGARLTNSTGMKLPAGPVTVFDGGVYAGDALVDFLPQDEKRLLTFGDDLSVNADVSQASAQETLGVTVSKGVMIFSRRITWTRTYTFRNASASAKKIVIEHPITSGTELAAPKNYDEKTAAVYRFSLPLPASGMASLAVKEQAPSSERVVLSSLGSDAFLSYMSSREIPAAIRDALKKAIDLKGKANDADAAVAALQTRKSDLSSDESRIRQNLSAVGRDSPQGQQYLKRLGDAETEIDSLGTRIDAALSAAAQAHQAYEAYLSGLSL
ncbi:MAG TPA: DUF4139 domain-containing protein [Rectinemataceae bacterium]|nr:DUF4139 domain-containing protein [Rectinemataceae bacterium]